jgi:hypothetical protein
MGTKIKQRSVWIDEEVLDALDPELSPNNNLRRFLGMPLKRTRGRPHRKFGLRSLNHRKRRNRES